MGVLVGITIAPRAERCLGVAFGDAPTPLDPHRTNRSTGWSVLAAFYDPLVELTPDLQPAPALAERWEALDPTHWRFELRPGVRFHDGSALTPADVVASIDRALTHPASAVRHYLTGVRAARAEAVHAVVIETAQPVPDLIRRLAFVLILPEREARREMITAPVGTGPYRFVERLPDGSVLAAAWSGWRGRPEFGNVRFEFSGNAEAALGRLLAGSVDVCHLVPDGSGPEVSRVPGLRLEHQPRLGVQLLSVDLTVTEGETRRALADRRVRKALLLALDRAGWVESVYRGNGFVASQYVHPAVFGFDPAITAAPFDPAAARALLADAGFPAGFSVVLGCDSASVEIAAAVARDLAAVGVRVEVRPGLKRAPLLVCSWACTTGDASDFMDSMVRAGSYSRTAASVGFADAETERLLDRADRETDAARRLSLIQEAQRRTLDLLPILPLTVRSGLRGVSAHVDADSRFDEREAVASFRRRP